MEIMHPSLYSWSLNSFQYHWPWYPSKLAQALGMGHCFIVYFSFLQGWFWLVLVVGIRVYSLSPFFVSSTRLDCSHSISIQKVKSSIRLGSNINNILIISRVYIWPHASEVRLLRSYPSVCLKFILRKFHIWPWMGITLPHLCSSKSFLVVQP